MTICLSHAKRRRINFETNRHRGLKIVCEDSETGFFCCHQGLRLVGISRARRLVNGMQYDVLEASLPLIFAGRDRATRWRNFPQAHRDQPGIAGARSHRGLCCDERWSPGEDLSEKAENM